MAKVKRGSLSRNDLGAFSLTSGCSIGRGQDGVETGPGVIGGVGFPGGGEN